jgi:HAD superfamily hydrolase (TIGR01509 family)
MKFFGLDILNQFKACLFDLDGTLVDSMPTHNNAWQEVLLRYGVNLSDDTLMTLAGTPNLATAEIFVAQFNLEVSPIEIVYQKELIFESSLPELQTIPAVIEVVELVHPRLPIAVVSGSSTKRIVDSLSITNLIHYFDAIISCEDTSLGKPHPDPYLLAAQRLGVAPSDCLVFEDGEAGMASALSAQMKVVQVKKGQLFFPS